MEMEGYTKTADMPQKYPLTEDEQAAIKEYLDKLMQRNDDNLKRFYKKAP